MEKKKVSAFEFAIMEIAAPQEAKNHRPETEQERNEARNEKIESFFERIKVVDEESKLI